MPHWLLKLLGAKGLSSFAKAEACIQPRRPELGRVRVADCYVLLDLLPGTSGGAALTPAQARGLAFELWAAARRAQLPEVH